MPEGISFSSEGIAYQQVDEEAAAARRRYWGAMAIGPGSHILMVTAEKFPGCSPNTTNN